MTDIQRLREILHELSVANAMTSRQQLKSYGTDGISLLLMESFRLATAIEDELEAQ